jgi:hypothetical protein
VFAIDKDTQHSMRTLPVALAHAALWCHYSAFSEHLPIAGREIPDTSITFFLYRRVSGSLREPIPHSNDQPAVQKNHLEEAFR